MNDAHRPITLWLAACCLLVLLMVVVGGVTRLTRSGLSIVEWRPITGIVPPLSEAAWTAEFDKYRATPEFNEVNPDMNLAGFKRIFWVEYTHRLIGRLTGLVFLVPFLYFLVRRRLPSGLPLKLAGIFALGGLQGALGWVMVKSGLVNDPQVSPYRLTAHLGLAVLIYGLLLTTLLNLRTPDSRSAGSTPGARHPALQRAARGLVLLVFVMILSGGFVAGTHAGYAFNSFPLMAGSLVPPGVFALEPWWRNLFENIATVQFDHRMIAWLLALLLPIYVWRVRRTHDPDLRRGSTILLHVLILQIALGIATLLSGVSIPVAILHQAGALGVFSATLYNTWVYRHRSPHNT